jgi:hypothetical protein
MKRKNDRDDGSASPGSSRVRRGVVLATVAAALVAAGARAETSVVVTRGSAALPPRCSPAEVAGLVQTFTDAEARGDLVALDRLFAPAEPNERQGVTHAESGFVEYSVTDRSGRTVGALDRSHLLPYFAGRHALHESLRFVQVAVFPKLASWPFRVVINYVLRGRADDLGDRVLSGKGQINCGSRTIALLQIDLEPPGTPPAQRQCPEPPGWTADGPLLACAMRPSAWAIAPDFRAAKRPRSRPARCAYDAALARLTDAFGAVDDGNATGFARAFAARAVLRPPGAAAVRGRAWIRRYAVSAVARVAGLTLTRLTATYRAGVEVFTNGRITGEPTLRVSVSCRSGLVTALR